MKSKKMQYMSIIAMFLAIQIILVVTPLGYLPIGPISATIVHILVAITGVAFGKRAGAQLDFVLGLTNVLNAAFRPTLTLFCFSPFVTIGEVGRNWMSLLATFVPGILLRYLIGLIYEKLYREGVNENVGITAKALTGAITNTVLVPSGIYLSLGSAYADAVKVAYDILTIILLGVVTTNGIVGAILRAVATLLVCKATRPITRKFN